MKTPQQEPPKLRRSDVILIRCIAAAVAAFGVFTIVQERFVGKTRQGNIVISQGWPAIWNGLFFIGVALIMLSIVLPTRIRLWGLTAGAVTMVASIMLVLM